VIEAVLFDLGDTLIHFATWKARPYLDALAHLVHDRLVKLGFTPPPFNPYRRAIRRRFACAFVWSRITRREAQLLGAFKNFHAGLGIHLSDEQVADLALLCITALRPLFCADEEAVEVVSSLQAGGYKLGVVSNTFFPSFAIDDVMRQDGLLDFFPVRVYSSDVRYMKPHRRIFQTALDRMGVAADRAMYVGDRLGKDVKGSGRVGMRTVLLSRSGRVRLSRFRPDHIVQRLSELPSLLQA
jgi:HAD superfamily hydrolase (TIGR01549 family)